MKTPWFYYLLYGSLFWCMACQPEQRPNMDPNYHPQEDYTQRAAPSPLSIQTAFVRLPDEVLVLPSFQHLSTKERRQLTKNQFHPSFECQLGHGYLEIKERPMHPDDTEEQLACLQMGLYSNEQENQPILFISEAWIQEGHPHPQIVQQCFLQWKQGKWTNITATLPSLELSDFFEAYVPSNDHSHWYFELNPDNLRHIKARLYHPRPNRVVHQEAYRVALVWNGEQFVRYRNPI